MKLRVADEPTSAERLLPSNEPDAGIGVNYADVYLKALKVTLAVDAKLGFEVEDGAIYLID